MENRQNKKYLIFFTAVIFFFGLMFFLSFRVYSIRGNFIEEVGVGGHFFFVERVESKSKMSLGLGGRRWICKKCGMLFAYDREGEHAFWMKGMAFPLDILWIREGRIVWMEKNIPPDSLEIMGKGVVSDNILEFRAGTADELGIKIGDLVSFQK